jgi:hypothetical protein
MTAQDIAEFWRQDYRNRILQAWAGADRMATRTGRADWRAVADQILDTANQLPADAPVIIDVPLEDVNMLDTPEG